MVARINNPEPTVAAYRLESQEKVLNWSGPRNVDSVMISD